MLGVDLMNLVVSGSDERLVKEGEEYWRGKMEVEEDEGEERIAGSIVF